ncbi:rCG50359 [Rattus norvegicus]|uniref:RCG50359 n=1 Tax=Rattus norvegicus TaxID=10116 RepID=A6JZ70_RAT|nr:rCG50359 [Rattus norvegicus]
MRGLPQWETEHWESGSFKDGVCLSLFSSFSQSNTSLPLNSLPLDSEASRKKELGKS